MRHSQHWVRVDSAGQTRVSAHTMRRARPPCQQAFHMRPAQVVLKSLIVSTRRLEACITVPLTLALSFSLGLQPLSFQLLHQLLQFLVLFIAHCGFFSQVRDKRRKGPAHRSVYKVTD